MGNLLGGDSKRWWARLSRSAPRRTIEGLAVGAVGALGLPGIDVWPCSLLAFLILDWRSQTFPHPGSAAWFGLGWATGFMVPFYLGALTWGTEVLGTVWVVHSLLYVAPRVVWSRVVARRIHNSAWVCVHTAAAWALWLSLCEQLGCPNYLTAISLMDCSALVSGARWWGGAMLDGILVSVSMVIAHSLRSREWGRCLTTTAVCGLFLVLSSWSAFRWAPEAERTVEVGVPQINVSSVYYKARVLAPSIRGSFEERLSQLLEELTGVDLLVMTESFDGRFHLVFPSLRERWAENARANQRAILLASYLPETNGRKSNVIAGFDSKGDLVGVHRKVFLAPFGEATLSAGKDVVGLDVLPSTRVGPLVCLESMIRVAVRRQVENGANLLVASTSDITFRSTPLPFIHLAATRIRAVEEGRSIVWASNGGPSGLIDRWGGFVAATPFRLPAAARFRAEVYTDLPPFPAARNWWLVLAGLALVVGVVRVARDWRQWWDSPPDSAPSSACQIRHILGYTAIAALSVASVAATPAYVELMRGDPERSRTAIRDLVVDSPLPVGNPQLAWRAYETGRGDSAAGAISYFLAQYGFYVSAAAVEKRVRHVKTLEQASAALQDISGMHTAEVKTSPAAPVLPVLVRLTDGSFAVSIGSRSLDRPTVFAPNRGPPRPVDLQSYQSIISDGVGLLPFVSAER